MVFPQAVQQALESLLAQCDSEDLKKASDHLTFHYKTCGFLKEKKERLAYLATRMAATYEAILSVFKKIPLKIESFLDLGAGPCTGAFAAQEIWGDGLINTLVEKDSYFIELAKILGAKGSWKVGDLREISLDPHDLVCFGYSWGEILDDHLLKKSWAATNKALVIVEPGTPKGYSNILRARNVLIELGGHILAPCPHSQCCPLKVSDWCHFSARVDRSSLHRRLKGGLLPYEDEKYSYIIFTKEKIPQNQSRILRDPLKKSGHVHLDLCNPDGSNRHTIFSKREKEKYKNARKSLWGDLIKPD